MGGGQPTSDRLLTLLSGLDVGKQEDPRFDRGLDFVQPDDRALFRFERRGQYDSEVLKRLFGELPRAVSEASVRKACPVRPREQREPLGDCPYKLGLFIDLSGSADSATAALAARSADGYYRRIPSFVRAYFVAKKLDEFSEHLLRRGKLIRPVSSVFSVGELYGLQGEPFAEERDKFFGERLAGLLESLSEEEAGLDAEVEAITKMGLSDFETYIEILVALRGAFHRKYIIESLDATMLKNKPGALLAQARARHAPRRFALESRLMEVLLQIAVLRPGGDQGYFTGEMRIDDLLSFLRERYGLYIDQLPPGEGFAIPNIDERKALRSNVQAFTGRLREIGFYRDLSDAYVTQTVVPR